jgi:hypothetical protein
LVEIRAAGMVLRTDAQQYTRGKLLHYAQLAADGVAHVQGRYAMSFMAYVRQALEA